jgi:short-subunit dehydrogenase involved in D-alanine esterification of teichoic acids
MNLSSALGYLPFSTINPVYSGTEAWLHSWTINLGQRLAHRNGMKHINVVEIALPTLSTDLHRDRADPDDNKEKIPSALSTE